MAAHQWSFADVERTVVPEILDELPAADPKAKRSRRDLRMINVLMGNFRWMRKEAQRFPGANIVELGAGDGGLLTLLDEDRREATGRGAERVVGVDLAARPAGLPQKVEWVEGNVFEVLGDLIEDGAGAGGPSSIQESADRGQSPMVVIANLFLHHFKDEELRELGALLRGCEGLCISEPRRSRLAEAEGYALFPLVNSVTRHDMMVSIRAGFCRGELPDLLGLVAAEWEIREQETLLGAYRLLACRKR